MRVVHVIPVMDPATGGPPAVVAAVTSVLRARRVDAGVVCYEVVEARERVTGLMESAWDGATAGTPSPGEYADLSLRRGLGIDYLPPISGLEVPLAGNARRLLPEKLKGADVVHLHGVWDPITRVAGEVCRKLGIPYVISTHGMLEPWAINQKRWKKELFWRLGWGTLLQGAAGIHDYRPGPIEVLGREIKPRVWEIANGIFPGRVATKEETAGVWKGMCERWPGLQRLPVVLFLGRLTEQKGADLIVGAMEQADEVALLMAGADYGMREKLERMVKGSKNYAQGRVVFTGPVFGEEKAAMLAHAAMFMAPSRHEGFSMSVLEAMAAGLPCVLTPACHFQRAADAGAARVVAADSLSFANEIWELLDDPDGAVQMGAVARELVEREYTWEALVSKYEEMYNSVARR